MLKSLFFIAIAANVILSVLSTESTASCGGDENAVSGCGNCPTTCSNYKIKDTIVCTEICYLNACDCKKGYVLDENIKKCVKLEDCSPQCGYNETYSECVNGGCHTGRTCEESAKLNGTTICLKPIKCEKGCLCKESYVRNSKGDCILEKECPRTCNGDPNAKPGCGCSRSCSDYFANKQPTCTRDCKPDACDCKEGYVRDISTGKCKKPKDCPIPKCPKNEIFDVCPVRCPPETCPDGQVYDCAALTKPGSLNCKARCRCKDGCNRDSKGDCIPKDQCPSTKCLEPDQRWDPCPDPCALTTCEDLYIKRACEKASSESSEEEKCKGACVCKSGFYKNKPGQCISRENCLKCTGPHEYYSCGGACDNVCATLSQQNQTNCPIINVKCNEMCYCEEGYARDSNGICILISSCPPLKCTGPHEYYSCGGACDNVCATLSQQNQTNCPIINVKCNEMCYCEEGYARDSNGTCILISSCPPLKCTGPHEYYSCGGACDNVCATLSQQNQTNCPIINDACNEMCYCEEGYARDSNGTCILISSCPPLKCTGPHEYYSCGGACDNVCATLSQQNQTNCPIINDACNEMCYCEEGYARDSNGTCILISSCPPSCNGDPNTEPGCCSQTCSEYDSQITPVCNERCPNNACQCKKGYALDEQSGLCVLPKDCPC